MKSQIRFILFALLLPACGDRESVETRSFSSFVPAMPIVAPAPEPVVLPATQPEPAKLGVVAPALPTKYDEALADGRAAEAKGDHAGAIELLQAAIKLDKKQADPHIELARIYIATGERGLAMAAANKAVKLAPLSSQAWNTKGRAELNRFDYDAAIEAFSKAVELNRDNVWAWNNLGYTELTLKKYEAAAEHLGEAATRKGATAYMFNNLGTALEQLDRLDEARAAYEQGGTLGSKEALASRKRLEGVKTLAVAKSDVTDKPADKAEPKVKTYDLTDEGDVDAVTPDAGSGSGSDTGGGDDGSDAGVTKSTM